MTDQRETLRPWGRRQWKRVGAALDEQAQALEQEGRTLLRRAAIKRADAKRAKMRGKRGPRKTGGAQR